MYLNSYDRYKVVTKYFQFYLFVVEMFLYVLVYFFHVYSTIKEESKKYLFDMPLMIMAMMMTMLMTYLVSL